MGKIFALAMIAEKFVNRRFFGTIVRFNLKSLSERKNFRAIV